MGRRGYQPNVVTYSILLDGLCKGERTEEAMSLLEDMYHNGLTPNVVTYNTLMNTLFKRNKVEEALALHKEMGKIGCQPDVVTYRTLLDGLCKDERMDEAMSLLEEIYRNADVDGRTKETAYLAYIAHRMNERFANLMSTIDMLIDGECKSRKHRVAKELLTI
ncbi:hypothetical protein AMTR_s00074p00173610 [Amborella trichopoda]|uniref:Pentacotripeptide-repeat region of PRORP domain-containing protein n=1 Tax=Amborella trichopoda TaxID=13333 RepID=W1NQA8_AMBTC|nr:hypothetical protein AMTR_s00074p00173610 [Amborella trichopoda]